MCKKKYVLRENIALQLLHAKKRIFANPILKGLLIMKLAIRIFALFVVVAGAAAATTSSSAKFVSHQAANASEPIPPCGPPLCLPQNPPPGN
jgi:uncharacterized membrane protein